MKKWYYIFIAAVPVFFFFESPKKQEVVTSAPMNSVQKKNIIQDFPPAAADFSREPATVVSHAPSHTIALPPTNHKKHREIPKYETSFSLGRGVDVLSDVYAIETEKYAPSMGDAVGTSGKFTMVQSSSRPMDSAPAALDRSTGQIYPVSSIVKLADVTADLRSELLSSGLREYYYSEDLKVLYVETDRSSVINVYQELQKQGLQAELEVMRPPRKAR